MRKFIYGLFGLTLASVFIVILNMDVEWGRILKLSGIPIVITGVLMFIAGLRKGDSWQRAWIFFKGSIIFFGLVNLLEALWLLVIVRGTITTFEAVFYGVILFALLFTVSDWIFQAANQHKKKPASR